MDCKARGRCCPEAGKDPAAMEAAVAPGRERPWPAGAAGGAAIRARPRGPCRARRARAEVGENGSSEWGLRPGHPGLRGPRREADWRKGGAEPAPSFGVPHPCSLETAGVGDSRSARDEDGLGEARCPQFGGAPRGRNSKDPHPQGTHTCWATTFAHSGASSSPRAP